MAAHTRQIVLGSGFLVLAIPAFFAIWSQNLGDAVMLKYSATLVWLVAAGVIIQFAADRLAARDAPTDTKAREHQ